MEYEFWKTEAYLVRDKEVGGNREGWACRKYNHTGIVFGVCARH